MNTIKVLITGSDIGPERLAAEVRAISPRLDVQVLPNRDALATMAAEAEVIAGSLPSSLLPRVPGQGSRPATGPRGGTTGPSGREAPRLKWLHSWAAGVNVTPEIRDSSVRTCLGSSERFLFPSCTKRLS